MLRWSIASVCLGGGLEAKFSAAAKAGFRAVELLENDLTFYAGKPRDVRRLAADLGLEIVALQPLRDFEGAPEPQRRRNFDRAKRKLELTRELGAPLLCLSSSIAEDSSGDVGAIAADLAELADVARQYGLRLGYEALSWGRHIRDWTAAWEVVAKADRDNLGIVLDAFHICARNNPIEPIAALPGDRIALVEIADSPALEMDLKSLSRHYRCYPGQGDFPVIDFLDAVLRSGYRGPISLETYSEQFRGSSPASVGIDAMRSLRAAGDALRARRVERGEPPVAELAALPPTPQVEGPEFLEFAVADKQAQELSGLLEGLGFELAGRHRSKRVDLYAQGDIRLVVNRERNSFAHSFWLLHGAAVCAMALRVDRVDRALDRARALECASHIDPIGPGEARIPAVGGVEGSLIYFVDGRGADWRHDFVGEAKTPPQGPLKAIDHLSNVVRRNEFLSWLLFYETVLGFKADPPVEVYDPHGDFYSRSLSNPSSSMRIALNVGAGGATGASRFLDAFGGAGYQQIALSTDDIFSAVETARNKGVQFLPIPDNYYDDLATRFDIAPDLLARMREFGILYDRVKDGQFFHIYTRAFHNRFFFEILQRDHYGLFGAANTPLRLAAQAAVDEAESQLAADIGL